MSNVKEITVNQIENNSEFWKQGWEKGFTGFHQNEYNPTLLKHVKDLNLKNKTIFVPLCGKSLDMIYLAKLGAHVIGVEVVKAPVIEFFKENNLSYEQKDTTYTSNDLEGSIEIINRDLFKLEDLGHIDFLYDRASNVALPIEMRKEKYYPTIKRLINSETKILLLTMNHSGDKSFGPPYPVSEEETMEFYPMLKKHEVSTMDGGPRFKEVGINKLNRIVWANI